MPAPLEKVVGQVKRHPRIALGVGLGTAGGAVLAFRALFGGVAGEVQKTPTPQANPGLGDAQSALPLSTPEVPGRSRLVDKRSTVIYNGTPYKCATIKNPERPNAMRASMSVNGGQLPDADVLWIPLVGDPILDDLGRFGRQRPGEVRILLQEDERICVEDHGVSSFDTNGAVLYQRGASYELQAGARMAPQMQANIHHTMHAARGI